MPHANKRMRMLALDAVNAPTSYSFATFAPGISAPFYLTLTLITNRRILNYNPVNRGQISAMVVFGGGDVQRKMSGHVLKLIHTGHQTRHRQDRPVSSCGRCELSINEVGSVVGRLAVGRSRLPVSSARAARWTSCLGRTHRRGPDARPRTCRSE